MGWVNLISCLLPDPSMVRLETWGTELACCMDPERGCSIPNPVWGQAVRT